MLHVCKSKRTFLVPAFGKNQAICLLFIAQESRCLNCLAKGHVTLKCLSKGVCKFCQGKHHYLLHRNTSTFQDVKLTAMTNATTIDDSIPSTSNLNSHLNTTELNHTFSVMHATVICI